ncbi:lysylphosphatidylglycerol synthase transmembrane domain-containing protein [Actinomadura sp. WAC 06369]|uniref:lysylphosphatidylglycerol synthase transmembrane domain-containing protein n=1 Tax=Actinomadura sp. WAC 06369 TaxID=2203193 RepID=UPI000F794014|nr:lysylphosphatidylglycerol synthase transmembrane domain-containing protein [Actinomadura sp. WAC 06369]RSN67926.1 TIGR00374 family protein [Actinomadura sp. WAC 06369]
MERVVAEQPRAPRWRRAGVAVQWALVLGAVAALVLNRDRLPDPGALRAAAGRAEPLWLVLVVVGGAGSMGAFARLQRRLLRVGGLRMSLRRAFAITYAGNALSTTLPAGPAVSVVYTFRQFRRGGAPARLATAVILAGGVITTSAYTAIGTAALLAEPRSRGPVLAALAVPVAAALLAAPVLLRPGARRAAAGALRRAGGRAVAHPRVAPRAARAAAALAEARDVLRPSGRDWAALAALAVLNWAFDILALFAAAQAVGIAVPPHGVALAYFAAQAAGSALPLLPGGLGAVETSMAAALAALGAGPAAAVAAVALYRLVSYWAVVAVGWAAWAVLREGPRVSARARSARAGRLVLGCLRAASSGMALGMGYGAAAASAEPSRRP